MASKRDAVAAPTPPPEPVASPTAYREAASALTNLLDGFLVPLVAAREKLAAAGDAEAYVSTAQQRLDAITGMIEARLADARLADEQVQAAQRGAQERVEQERARVAEVRERANADIERIRAERAAVATALDAAHQKAAEARAQQLRALDEQITTRRAELANAEGALARVKAAHEEYARVVAAR